jgi:hypothetical protein
MILPLSTSDLSNLGNPTNSAAQAGDPEPLKEQESVAPASPTYLPTMVDFSSNEDVPDTCDLQGEAPRQ